MNQKNAFGLSRISGIVERFTTKIMLPYSLCILAFISIFVSRQRLSGGLRHRQRAIVPTGTEATMDGFQAMC